MQPIVASREVEAAARTVVVSALGVGAGERFVVFTDEGSARVGDALGEAAREVGAAVEMCRLDELAARPLKALPDDVCRTMSRAAASAFVASAPHDELGMRQQILHIVGRHGVRHAHMPNVSRLAFARGLRTNYAALERNGRILEQRLAGARELIVRSYFGTDLRVELDPDRRWFPQLGVIQPGRWSNLPAGALYATPSDVNGRFTANASLGEFFGAREGLLVDKPVVFDIEHCRVVRVRAERSLALQRDVSLMLSASENSNRIGLVALGVNSGIASPTGEALVDQNMPGLHLAIGDPAARVTGASWQAPTSFAACQSGADVIAGDVYVIRRGRFVVPD